MSSGGGLGWLAERRVTRVGSACVGCPPALGVESLVLALEPVPLPCVCGCLAGLLQQGVCGVELWWWLGVVGRASHHARRRVCQVSPHPWGCGIACAALPGVVPCVCACFLMFLVLHTCVVAHWCVCTCAAERVSAQRVVGNCMHVLAHTMQSARAFVCLCLCCCGLLCV